MKMRLKAVISCLLLTTTISFAAKDAVLLSDVKVITLRAGQQTTGRRSSPVPQLRCLAGCEEGVTPNSVQCTNVGSDGNDAQWNCQADLPSTHQFGKIEVNCEGYQHPEDKYILKGSCGLEYSLELTKEGQQRWRNSEYARGGYGSRNMYQSENDYEPRQDNWAQPGRSNSGSGSTLFMTIVVAVVAYLIYRSCMRLDHHGGGGGGGYGGNDFPGGRPFQSGQGSGYGNNYPGDQSYKPSSMNSAYGYTPTHTTNTANSGPGFWSGALAGGAMGYLFGSRNTGPTYRTHYGYGTQPAGGFGFSSSSAPSAPTQRTASGFGGTRRR